MSWYKPIKTAASPKNIVNQWKIDDPYLKFFIYTYEPLIDLSKIKNENDLNTFIKSELIPGLKSKIDINNPNGYYKKTMTNEEVLAEVDEHEADPRIQQAVHNFKQDPASAKKILLNVINEDKKLSFDKWWKYMEDEQNINPAFFYSMLNPMIESSPAGQKNGPPPASRKAIDLIKNEIGSKGVTQMNVFKKFVKNSFKLDQKSSETIDIDDNKSWIRIDSKLRNPQSYKDNQEKLMRFATDSGWCIAQNHYSDIYLSKGDFWLYFENKRPKVAIRMVGNGEKGQNKVEEIRGLYNKEKTLDPYWEPVTTFLHNTDFNYQNQSHYKRLKDIMYKNVDLETDPEAYRSILKAIQLDPKQIGIISDENKAKFPELVQAAAVGYEKRINVLLDSVEGISTTGNDYSQRFSQFQDEFNDIPEEVRHYMSNDIEGRLVSVHKKAFARNPLEYEFFPDDIKEVITPEEQKIAWSTYVGQDPYRYNDLRIPTEVRKYIPIGPILQGWARLVDMNISHADNIPSVLLNITNSKGQRFFPENYIENKIISDFKKYPCNKTSQGYDKLDRIRKRGLLTEEQIAQVYADFVTRNANNKKMQNPILYIPPQYRDAAKGSLTNLTPIADKYYQKVLSNASYFNPIDDSNIRNILLNDERYRKGVVESFKRLRQNSYGNNWNGFWKDIPDDVKAVMPDDIKQSVANIWIPYVQQNPTYLNNLDNHIRPLVEQHTSSQNIGTPLINEAYSKNQHKKRSGKSWYKKANQKELWEIDPTGQEYNMLDIDTIDKMAFGFTEDEIKRLSPNALNIKWQQDLENVIWEQENSGKTKEEWAMGINLLEPIDVIFEDGMFKVDDGHHRYYAASILGSDLNVSLEIKDKPHKTAVLKALQEGKKVPYEALKVYPELIKKQY